MITDKELEAIHQVIAFVMIIIGVVLITELILWAVKPVKFWFKRFVKRKH